MEIYTIFFILILTIITFWVAYKIGYKQGFLDMKVEVEKFIVYISEIYAKDITNLISTANQLVNNEKTKVADIKKEFDKYKKDIVTTKKEQR